MTPLHDCIKHLSRPLPPEPTGEQPSLPKIEGIRAVVFDIYGTLLVSGSGDISLASKGSRGSAAVEALSAVNVELPTNITGDSVVESLHTAILESHALRKAELADCNHPEVEIRDIWRDVLAGIGCKLTDKAIELLAIEYECRVNPVWPMPGMLETLDVIRAAGIKLGIVSNAQFFTPIAFEALADRSLAQLGFDDPMLCGWSYERRVAKPDPALHSHVMKGLGKYGIYDQREVLYVGNDMLNDVWTAKSASMQAVLFAGDKRSLRWRADVQRVADVLPDAVVTDLRQILSILSLAEG